MVRLLWIWWFQHCAGSHIWISDVLVPHCQQSETNDLLSVCITIQKSFCLSIRWHISICNGSCTRPLVTIHCQLNNHLQKHHQYTDSQQFKRENGEAEKRPRIIIYLILGCEISNNMRSVAKRQEEEEEEGGKTKEKKTMVCCSPAA